MIKVYFLQHKVHSGCFWLMGSSSSGGASETQTPSLCGPGVVNKSLCSCTWSQERENSTGHGAWEAGEVHPQVQGSFHHDSWPSFLWFTSRSWVHQLCSHSIDQNTDIWLHLTTRKPGKHLTECPRKRGERLDQEPASLRKLWNFFKEQWPGKEKMIHPPAPYSEWGACSGLDSESKSHCKIRIAFFPIRNSLEKQETLHVPFISSAIWYVSWVSNLVFQCSIKIRGILKPVECD